MPPENFDIGDYEFCLEISPIQVEPITIDKAIRRDNATIIFWSDGEKTVVKCRECGDNCPLPHARKKLREWEKQPPTEPNDKIERMGTAFELALNNPICSTHFDQEKAIMAAMLKRFYHGYQKDLRHALDVLEVQTDE